MSETLNTEQSQRPTIDQLKAEIASGKTVHEAVGDLIKSDSTTLYERWMTMMDGKTEALSQDIIDIYEIRDEKYNKSLEDNLLFVEGFDHLAKTIYPILIRATRLKSELQPDLTSEQLADIAKLPESLQESTQNTIREDNFSTEEARRCLINDPNGVGWLEQRVNQRYGKFRYFESLGAYKAIKGVEKLYEILSPKAPEASSKNSFT